MVLRGFVCSFRFSISPFIGNVLFLLQNLVLTMDLCRGVFVFVLCVSVFFSRFRILFMVGFDSVVRSLGS